MEERLKRNENEKFYTYVRRLVDGKFKDNTLTDYDHTEIYKAIYGIEVNSSEARKRMYGLRDFFANFNEEELNNITEDETLQELESKRVEIEKERKKLQATKIEYNRNLRKDSRFELFYENIKDSKDRLPLPKFNEVLLNDYDNGEYLLSIADIHYGANFQSENNNYSREEVKRRFEVLLSKTRQIVKKNEITTLYIIELADTVQGLLRISDITLNDIPVVDSVVEVSRLIATFLNELSKDVNIVYRHTMASNHTQNRYLGTKASEMPSEDMEHIIGNYIKDLVSNNPRIEVILSENDYNSFELCGQSLLCLHGHQVKSVKNAIKDYSMLHRKFYDICLLAHFHAGQSMSVGESNGNTEVVVCSGFVGSDPYSDSLKVGSKGMCKLFKIEESLGITETYTIVLN